MAFHQYLMLMLSSTVFFLLVREGTTMPKGPPPWAKAKAFGHDNLDGDILLNQELLQRLQSKTDPEAKYETRNILKDSKYKWPGGVVPFIIDSSFDDYPHERTMINSAIGEVHKVSCVRFVQRTSEAHYITFVRGSGCSSYVGYLKMAAQPVSIGTGCAFTGTIVHELLHVLGFFHTSSRKDRDSYVVVYPDNVQSGYEHNFWKYNSDQIQNFGAPYELVSLMQPPRNAWSKNSRNTIESRKGPSVVLGNPDRMTEIDIGQLNTLYECTNYKVCYQWLGMQDGRITDSQLTASSHTPYDDPHQARLHLSSTGKGNGAWCAGSNSVGQWIKIDLGSYKYLKGIATQGKVDPFSGSSWVTHYNFHFSYDDSYWYDYATWYSTGLTGNFDDFSVQYNSLPVVISARYIKILPSKWNRNMCMRIELYGCDV
ncbi:zinc metalloproteinase nas-4-like [Actinia tenebrosa]|uniref:Metalloendopeptidase n=1 Tax=Actinia tenebrosa TaxID=6105 RepID=A0A6P8IUE1_ACTTE|nr:zinc metalloproteinase nas-4-like [Actinia tenebrosa]